MKNLKITAILSMLITLLMGNTAVLSESGSVEDVMTNASDTIKEQATEILDAREVGEGVDDIEEGDESEEDSDPALADEAPSEAVQAETVTGFGKAVAEDSSIAKASDIREEIEQTGVKVYVNNPPSRYNLLKKLRSEVFVLDAKSESDAELLAFKQLKAMAKELGADALIEVKRSIVKDSIAQLERPKVTGSMLGMDMDPSSIPLDELMLSNYMINKGTLSSRIIEDTFEASSDLSHKAVRFTGKAIILNK